VLGADYLFWEQSAKEACYDGYDESLISGWLQEYKSSRVVLLSVEPFGAQLRRVGVFPGSEPPKFAPQTHPPTEVLVNGIFLDYDPQIKD
jgi:hypothetical protein